MYGIFIFHFFIFLRFCCGFLFFDVGFACRGGCVFRIMPFLVGFLPFGGLLGAGWYISLSWVEKVA